LFLQKLILFALVEGFQEKQSFWSVLYGLEAKYFTKKCMGGKYVW